MVRFLLAALLVAGLVACGEPAVPLAVPDRGAEQHVLDLAGVLDEAELARPLARLVRLGWDPVLVTFEADDASLGLADRAGRKVLDAWGADLVLVAVAEPGDFRSDAENRRRFFGLVAREVHDVPRGLRERVAEQLVPPLASENAWTEAFAVAMRALAEGLDDVDGR